LGLPIHVRQSRVETFEYLKDIGCAQRVQGWKERLLSKAGKVVFIASDPDLCYGLFWPTYTKICVTR
jgi:hypothetical protein